MAPQSQILRKMKMAERTALVAFHNEETLENYNNLFRRRGYIVSTASSLDEMLEKMGISKDDSLEAKPRDYYNWYLMDTNLGVENGSTCDSAAIVYGLIAAEVKEGKVKFMSLTSNSDAVQMARNKGIPAIGKLDFDGVMKMLNEIEK